MYDTFEVVDDIDCSHIFSSHHNKELTVLPAQDTVHNSEQLPFLENAQTVIKIGKLCRLVT